MFSVCFGVIRNRLVELIRNSLLPASGIYNPWKCCLQSDFKVKNVQLDRMMLWRLIIGLKVLLA